jgi:hypothetical protein
MNWVLGLLRDSANRAFKPLDISKSDVIRVDSCPEHYIIIQRIMIRSYIIRYK